MVSLQDDHSHPVVSIVRKAQVKSCDVFSLADGRRTPGKPQAGSAAGKMKDLDIPPSDALPHARTDGL
jgi:hypothetical protein